MLPSVRQGARKGLSAPCPTRARQAQTFKAFYAVRRSLTLYVAVPV